MNGLRAINITIDINTFILCWLAAGLIAPFIVFFGYGLVAYNSKLSSHTKLAIGWGSACFFLPMWIFALSIYCCLIGQNPPDSVPPFFVGVVQGILLLTIATVCQWGRINKQEEKARKKTYSFS